MPGVFLEKSNKMMDIMLDQTTKAGSISTTKHVCKEYKHDEGQMKMG